MICLEVISLFCQPCNHSFGKGKQTNAANDSFSEMFHKIIQKTVLMDYSLSKVADLQPETFKLKRDPAMLAIFQNSHSVLNLR